ncbi:MAG: hypothetical protein JNM07_04575 [Phycisphaerae bacterium]|nr:hypothetical protein [Phycisphaerae bacterium]
MVAPSTIPAPAPDPRAAAPLSPPTTPTPTTTTAIPPVPAPSSVPSPHLCALIAANFNPAALSSSLSPEQLLALAADHAARAHLGSLLDFFNTCNALRQAQFRAEALDALRAVAATSTDPIEKRRAATTLLHAPAPIRPAPAPADSLAAPTRPRAPSPVRRTPPAPTSTPRAGHTPAQIIAALTAAIASNHTPTPDSGLATLAAFCDDDATLDGAVLPIDDRAACIRALADSPIGRCRPPARGVAPPPIPDLEPDDDGPVDITLTLDATRDPDPDHARNHDDPHDHDPHDDHDHDDHHDPTDDDLPAHEGTVEITLTLQRRGISRHPGCWLVTDINTS